MPVTPEEIAALSGAMAEAVRAAVKPGAIKSTLPLLKKDDVASYLTFKEAFRRLVRTEAWDDAQAVKMVWRAIEGEALELVGTTAEALTLEAQWELFDAVFMPSSCAHAARVAFDTSCQKSDEDVRQWHNRCRCLFVAAFPEYKEEYNTSKMLIYQFCKGLRHAAVRAFTFNADCATYADALVKAQRQAATNLFTNDVNKGTVVGALQPAGGNGRRRGNCWNCGRQGHLKRECTAAASPNQEERPANGSNSGPRRGGNNRRRRGGGNGNQGNRQGPAAGATGGRAPIYVAATGAGQEEHREETTPDFVTKAKNE